MLKREITYETLDGDTVTNTFYFNLTKAEITELELGYDGGITGFIQRVSATQDNRKLIEEFKRIILLCYGVREGDSFVKTQELRDRFAGSNAYSELFMEFLTVPGSVEEFLKGVMPKVTSDSEPAKAPVMPPPPLPPATVEAGHQIVKEANS